MFLQRFWNLENNFARQANFAKSIGLQLEDETEQSILDKPKKFFGLLICSLIVWLSVLWHFILSISNILKIMESVWILAATTSALIALFLFLLKVRRVRKLKSAFEKLLHFQKHKSRLECLLENAIPADKSNRIWKAQQTQSQILVSIYNGCSWTATLAFFLRPILVYVLNYEKQDSNYLKPPLESIFPYDNTKQLNLALTYCLYWCAVIVWRNAMLMIDSVFCWFLFSARAHFKILREKLRELAENVSADHSTTLLKRESNHIYAYHQQLAALIKEFAVIFSSIILVQTLLCVLQFCFVLNSMSTDIDLFTRLFLIIAFALFGMRLSFYCFGGEQIQKECELTCDEFYLEMAWEHVMDKSLRRSFLMFLNRLQKPEKLRGGDFFVANRELFVRVLNTAYTYAAFVQAKM